MNELVKYYTKNNLLTVRKFKEISQLYNLDKERLLEKYNEAFLSTFKRAYKYSEFYKKFYREHGIAISDIKDLTDIVKLPKIDRHLIKQQVNNIYYGFDFLKVKGLTSGTSGSPLTVYRTPFDIVKEQAYLRHYRNLNGLKVGQPLLSIRGTLGKSIMFQHFKKANILYISSPNINANTIDYYHKLIRDFAPVAVEAFPSYLYKMTTELEKKGLGLKIPNAFTSSETLYEFQKDKIEPFLQTKIHDWYGNVERTIAFAQDKSGEYYPLPLYSINEFEKDKIITTGLINSNFPLIRYAVDDIIAVDGNDFLQNIASPKIIRIEGRTGDTVELKDGSIVGCLDHAFKGVDNIDCAQIHQFSVDKPLQIKLVVSHSFTPQDEVQLGANLNRMIGNMPIDYYYCQREDLTYSANQKYKLVIKHTLKAV